MNLENFASNLHQNGENEKIEAMNTLADKMEVETNFGLAGAFLTNGVYDKYDVVAMLANSKEYEHKQGYIFYDNKQNKAVLS